MLCILPYVQHINILIFAHVATVKPDTVTNKNVMSYPYLRRKHVIRRSRELSFIYIKTFSIFCCSHIDRHPPPDDPTCWIHVFSWTSVEKILMYQTAFVDNWTYFQHAPHPGRIDNNLVLSRTSSIGVTCLVQQRGSVLCRQWIHLKNVPGVPKGKEHMKLKQKVGRRIILSTPTEVEK